MKPLYEFAVNPETISSWAGKHPRGVLEAILLEFESKFIEIDPVLIQNTRLNAKLKKNDWGLLLDTIHKFSHNACDNSLERIFFNSLLSNSGLWRLPDNKNRKSNNFNGEFLSLDFCVFCWSTVPVFHGSKSRVLCNEHKFGSRSKEYKRFDRMANKAIHGKNAQQRENDLKFKIYDIFMDQVPSFERDEMSTINLFKTGKIPHSRLKHVDYDIKRIISSLPHLEEHLLNNNVDTRDKTLVYDFLNKKIITDYEQVKVESIRNRQLCLANFYYCGRQLARAEIWLELKKIANKWHGGPRKRSSSTLNV
jgi:hypothetical protein